MSKRLFKVLGEKGAAFHGGSGRWSLPRGKRPGKWMPAISDPVPCERGYHLCRERDLVLWLGPVIYEVEARGERIESEDKIVVSEARLLRRLETWNERSARLFAADCAEAVLPIFESAYPRDERPRKAIEAARAFARGEIDAAARAAAWAAAWAAARAAAMDAAGAAARAAARDAAYAARDAARDAAYAARDAAWAAAGAAAWDAAGDAARGNQTLILMRHLYPKEQA